MTKKITYIVRLRHFEVVIITLLSTDKEALFGDKIYNSLNELSIMFYEYFDEMFFFYFRRWKLMLDEVSRGMFYVFSAQTPSGWTLMVVE